MSNEDNLKLASKTNEWAKAGLVVGIDLAGPESRMNLSSETELAMVKACYETATNGAKVGKTIHIGETDHTSVESMVKVIEAIEPHRIGHGIRAVKAAIEEGDYRAIDAIKAHGIVLEICPYSNLLSGAIRNMDEMRVILELLYENQVPFMLGTDGLCIHGFDPETTARRNGHFGVSMADEAVMLWLCGISDEVLKYGLLNGERYSFL
jgi:adenosine deaminase